MKKLGRWLIIILLFSSLFTGLLPDQNVRATWIYTGIYFKVGYTNYTVSVPINFTQIIINASNITFSHLKFNLRQIPTVSKINVSFATLIADPLTATSGTLITDFTRLTSAVPIKVWYNVSGFKTTYAYRYKIDGGATWYNISSNASGGINFSSTLTGTHQYQIYDLGGTSDTTPPAITINYAGHLNDKGGPYWQPPGETTALSGAWLDGYYTNDSYQYEKFIYINCTITDTSAISTHTLRWWNVTANTWSNVTSLTARNTNYYDLNYSTGIGGASKYSFNIRAADSSGNYRNTFWNKTDIGSDITRRYVHLGCTPTSITYMPFYLYNTSYDFVTDLSKKDRLHHDQGTDAGGTNPHDVGFLLSILPTDTLKNTYCTGYCSWWYDENTCDQPITITNIYYHVWYNDQSPSARLDKVGWKNSNREDTSTSTTNYYVAYDSNSRSNIYVPGAAAGYPLYFNLTTRLLSVTSSAYTDNNIYQLELKTIGYFPDIISNRSFTSFILFNVPSNASLNASYVDSDSDGLSDWTELYMTYTNPFLQDTDNDGQDDSYEDLYGSDPNNYTDRYLVSSPIVTTNTSTGIGATNATLWGYLDYDGSGVCNVNFEYGTTTSYGSTTSTQIKTSGQTFSSGISGLIPATTYHYRAKAVTGTYTSYGSDMSFITTSTTPTVTTNDATNIGAGTARLNGYLNYDGGSSCTVNFEYGLTIFYGYTTPGQTKITGQSFLANLIALTPGATYHFRAKAVNGGYTAYGVDKMFTLPGYPVVVTNTSTGVGETNATLWGYMSSKGGTSTCNLTFQYGFTTAYGNLTSKTMTSSSTLEYSKKISGLFSGVPYHYRARATNGYYFSYGADKTFVTLFNGSVFLGEPCCVKANWTTSSSVNISWIKGIGCTGSKILRKIGSYPLSIVDGTVVYNGIGNYYNDTGLSPETRYFYKIYGTNATTYSTGLSVSFVETDNTTATTFSAIGFKGYLTTDHSIQTRFVYSNTSDFTTTAITSITLQQNYTELTNWNNRLTATTWAGESFKTGATGYYIHNITMKLKRVGGPGVLAVYLYEANTSGATYGLPTGAILSSGTTNANVIPTTYTWVNVSMSSYKLKSNTLYCFMAKTDGVFPVNYLHLASDGTPTYSDGCTVESLDSGATFHNDTSDYPGGTDSSFEIWGATYTIYASGQSTASISLSTTNDFTIVQSSLNPGTLYYYKALGNDSNGNMTQGNTRFSLTNPGIPIFVNLIPYFDNASVNISWIVGAGANQTVLIHSHTSYPDTVSEGVISYNGTGTWAWVTNISFNTTYYFSIFSFTAWGVLSRWSSHATVPWGGITFIVHNESAPWQIINATITVTDSEGLYPVQFINVYGWQSFNISQIPYGENTLFYVTNESYASRLYVLDVVQNIFYNFSFYLPPLHLPGNGSTGWNITASYMVQILNQYQYPVPDALVKFYRYFNTTGNYTYIGGFVSDGTGQGSITLFPYQLYMIKIICDGFEEATYFWAPNIVEQSLIKQFMIYPLEVPKYLWDNLTSTIIPVDRNQHDSFTVYYNITSSDSQLEWFSGQVYKIHNTTGALISLYYGNFSIEGGGSISYTIPNSTGRYYFRCMFKKIDFDTYKYGDQSTYTYILSFYDASVHPLEEKIVRVMGRSPVFVITASGETVVSYIALFVTFIIIMALFTLSPKFAGFAIVLLGALIGFLKGPLGLISDVILNWTVAGTIIILGIILAVTKKKEEEPG